MKTTKKQLISLYRDLAQRIGKQPTRKHWNEDANTPSDMLVRLRFGSWGKFLKAMDLKPIKVIPIGARKGKRNRKGVKKVLTKFGYYDVFEPTHPLAKKNGYVREHRMIAYDAGILKNKTDEVHHKNGIKTDNRIENLEVMAKEKHTSVSWKGKKRGGWSEERRAAKSKQMKGNQNWRGNIYENPELLK